MGRKFSLEVEREEEEIGEEGVVEEASDGDEVAAVADEAESVLTTSALDEVGETEGDGEEGLELVAEFVEALMAERSVEESVLDDVKTLMLILETDAGEEEVEVVDVAEI